jgi:thiamine-phosphate pyrophosphorylase
MRGLYAIADAGLIPRERLIECVEQAIAGGARLIQYRDKCGDATQRRRHAMALSELCRRHKVPLLINDDVELAGRVGADGVHLGRDDTAPAAARRRLGPGAIIGVSCYNRIELAQQAAASGADYVAFGRFFPSRTKPHAVQADMELLARARSELDLSLAVIGGITPDNAGPLIAAGADLLAVIHGLFGEPDVRAAAIRYARLFDNGVLPDTLCR